MTNILCTNIMVDTVIVWAEHPKIYSDPKKAPLPTPKLVSLVTTCIPRKIDSKETSED